MNLAVNDALKRAAEKVVRRPLHAQEEFCMIAAFYQAEGPVADRIVAAICGGTQVPRGLIERAASTKLGAHGICGEIAAIEAAEP